MDPTESTKPSLVRAAQVLREQPLVWNENREKRAVEQVYLRREKRKIRRAQVQTAAVLVSAAALALVLWPKRSPENGVAQSNPGLLAIAEITSDSVRLPDASAIHLRSQASRLRTLHNSPELIDLELMSGGAEFSITKNPKRAFRVRFRDVVVQVMGTVFETERRDEQLFVRVIDGAVEVIYPGKSVVLSAGQSGIFPPASAAPTGADSSTAHETTPGSARLNPRAIAPVAAETDEAAALQESIDRSRAQGDYQAAAMLCQTFLQKHAGNVRAPLVLFTLGKIQLEGLRQPIAAAETFAEVQKRAGNSPLVEDALAREVEALAQAGQTDRAHARALDYVGKYPAGQRAEMVRHFGKLD